MKIVKEIIKFRSKKELEFKDLTELLVAFVKKHKIKSGFLIIQALHTSATIVINEKESCFFKDFEDFMKKVFPKESYYRHNDLSIRTENLVCSDGSEECMNGHSHIAHVLAGSPTANLIVENGKLLLGRWQRVFFLELDSPRNREVALQIIGV